MKYIKEFCTCRTKNQNYILSVFQSRVENHRKPLLVGMVQYSQILGRKWNSIISGILNSLYRVSLENGHHREGVEYYVNFFNP